ncbi:MAG: flavodoxin family protein [Methanobacterium sp.]
MDFITIAKFVGFGIIIIALIITGTIGFILYRMSYTATKTETLNPSVTPIGNALVVYDPGISGAAKNLATVIASDLQAKGYKVNIAGIKSATAANTSNYNVIIVGGPTYGASISKSVQSYLSTLNSRGNAKIGVFTTGMISGNSDNTTYILKQIPLPNNSTLQINTVVKVVNGEDINQKAAGFVDALIN